MLVILFKCYNIIFIISYFLLDSCMIEKSVLILHFLDALRCKKYNKEDCNSQVNHSESYISSQFYFLSWEMQPIIKWTVIASNLRAILVLHKKYFKEGVTQWWINVNTTLKDCIRF